MMQIKAMTFNIRFDNPNDGLHQWKYRRSLLSQVINQFEPALLGTQEGRQPQLDDLSSLLPGLRRQTEHRDWIEERMYPCIFINPELIHVHHSGDIWLSETPHIPGSKSFESSFPRLCTWIEASTLNREHDFFFVVVHLDHKKSSTRQEQIKVLHREIQKVNQKNLPVILTGDFNEHPEGPVRKYLTNSWSQLIDPWLTHKKEEETSFHKFGEMPENPARIDWFLVDQNYHCPHIEIDQFNQNSLYPSDHFPVKITLEY